VSPTSNRRILKLFKLFGVNEVRDRVELFVVISPTIQSSQDPSGRVSKVAYAVEPSKKVETVALYQRRLELKHVHQVRLIAA
jgi:hypothetical protein